VGLEDFGRPGSINADFFGQGKGRLTLILLLNPGFFSVRLSLLLRLKGLTIPFSIYQPEIDHP
jgi:hypothetical protein